MKEDEETTAATAAPPTTTTKATPRATNRSSTSHTVTPDVGSKAYNNNNNNGESSISDGTTSRILFTTKEEEGEGHDEEKKQQTTNLNQINDDDEDEDDVKNDLSTPSMNVESTETNHNEVKPTNQQQHQNDKKKKSSSSKNKRKKGNGRSSSSSSNKNTNIDNESSTNNNKRKNGSSASTTTATKNNNATATSRRRKRGRNVRKVTIVDQDDSKLQQQQQQQQSFSSFANKSVPPLPSNQYTTTLRRRAVRKLEEGSTIQQQQSPDYDDGEYGDISLGMKLIVVGGRVIVQSLNSLADGLASPAQLAGIIQRGDVLLAIGSLSLVNLPVDQLMEGLRPLSTPGPDGRYQRFLDLRFEGGTGLQLLKVHEDGQARTKARQEPADAMFSLFPMVDQLSGAPLFDHHYDTKDDLQHEVENDENEGPSSAEVIQSKMSSSSGEDITIQDLDVLISSTLAKERMIDRNRYASEYFDWREDLTELLRKSVNRAEEDGDDNAHQRLTQTERLQLGKKIMQLTKALELNMEEIDKGRDLRSFKTWSTNFSLRSGVSARRRYMIDTSSVLSSRGTSVDTSGDEASVDSDGSDGSLGAVDADTLLLGLAARDEIWRRQVLDALNKATRDIDQSVEEREDEEDDFEENHVSKGIDEALRESLGGFLFGDDISKIVKQEKPSHALPPREITRVLFDLTTNLATKAPDEITVFGASSKLSSNISSFQSGTTRTDGKSRAALRADVLLANRFVLDEALPKWLDSFRPLPLDQRRVLWPRTANRRDSTTGTFSADHTIRSMDNDALTIDSGGSSVPSRKKDLRELVEDQQIDGETRSET